MLGGIIHFIVDAENNRQVFILCRGRNDNFLCTAAIDVRIRTWFCIGAFAVAENTGRFDHDFNTEVSPGQISRIAFCQNLHLFAIDDDIAIFDFNGTFKAAIV